MTQKRSYRNGKDILAHEDAASEEVFVPEWDTLVRVRVMSGQDRERWETAMIEQRNAGRFVNFRAWLVAQTVVDESGARLFSDEQIPELGRKSSLPLAQLFEVAQRLNRLDEKAIVATEKNSEAGLKGSPGSDSR